MHSSGMYIHGSWKWQLIQLSINLGDTGQGLNENRMQEKWGKSRKEWARDRQGDRRRIRQKEKWGERGQPTIGADKSGSGKVKCSKRSCWLYSNKQNHMWICMSMHAWRDAATQSACTVKQRLPAHRSVYISLYRCVTNDWGWRPLLFQL